MDELDKSQLDSPEGINGLSSLGNARRAAIHGARREVRISGGVPPIPRLGGESSRVSASVPSEGLSGLPQSASSPSLGEGGASHRVPSHRSGTMSRASSSSLLRPLSGMDGGVEKSGSEESASVASGSSKIEASTKSESESKSELVAESFSDDCETVAVTNLEVDASGIKSGQISRSGRVVGLTNGKVFESGEITAEPELQEVPMASLPIGMKIDDRYEILSVLGVGGFATVYRAHHLTIDRDVALKVMDLKKGVDPSYSERFFREAKIAAKIHHNNVVSIYDFGHVAETAQPYIAMEMLHGHDLSHELNKNGPLSPNRAFVLFRPVLEALSEGHRLGIVHKDLKPENLYLVDPGGPRELMKILDFGVARISSSEVAKLTSAGQLLGTPRYLAPEYITSQNVSPAIDVYQMALILSEALTGIPAVSGDPFHAMMLHCSGQLQIADFLLEGRVGEVFRKAIAIEPSERYENCEAFAEALDTVADCFSGTVPLKGGAPQLTPESSTSVKTVVPSMTGFKATGVYRSEEEGKATEPPKHRSSMLRVFVVLLLLICCGLGVAYYLFEWHFVTESPKEIEAPVVAPKPDPRLTFEFQSEPSGAQVTRNTRNLCVTPCRREFKQSELQDEYKPLIVFKLDGYADENLEITEDLFKKTSGKVLVNLTKNAAKELPFKFEYTPVFATVTEADTGKTVCKLSPCTYVFSVEQTAVTLTFSAPEYYAKNVALTAADFSESPISVDLEKRPVQQPVVRRPAKSPKNEKASNTDSNSASAQKNKPEEKKEEVKKEQPKIKVMF